jgi:hypothetical protein
MSPFFMRDAPEGVRVIAPPITGQRSGFELHVNVDLDIKLIVDVAKIGSAAAALWVIERIRRSKIDLRPRINGKELPKGDDEAVKMLKDAIPVRDSGQARCSRRPRRQASVREARSQRPMPLRLHAAIQELLHAVGVLLTVPIDITFFRE